MYKYDRLKTKHISIVILNYNNWQDTIECLKSVLNISFQLRRIIIVDNDSRDDSIIQIKFYLSKVSGGCNIITREQAENGEFIDCPIIVIKALSNAGYAAGNNIGIRWAIRAGDEYVLILNNDTLVENKFLEPLVDFLDSHETVALVGPKIMTEDGNIDRNSARRRPEIGYLIFGMGFWGMLFHKNRYYRRHHYIGEYEYCNPRMVDIVSGSCMLIRTEIIKAVGLLDEKTFLFLEEFILHEKLRSLNMATYVIPQSHIVHKRGQSIKISPLSFIINTMNKSLLYYLTHYRQYPLWFTSIVYFNNQILNTLVLIKHILSRSRGK